MTFNLLKKMIFTRIKHFIFFEERKEAQKELIHLIFAFIVYYTFFGFIHANNPL